MKRIGVMTSGGDSPGMNAAIRAVLRTAIYNGLEVFGIRRGYSGLMEADIYEMNLGSVADIIQRGGTILKTARSTEFKTDEGQNKALNVLRIFKIDGLVVIGGDGSFRGAKALYEKGFPIISIPGTIDNDMGYTDATIGFDTVINTVTESIGRLRDTTESHGRATIVEVMGRNCGDIALYSGLAGGADSIVLPEKEIDVDAICKKLLEGKSRGKKHAIIVFAEGEGKITPFELAKTIEKNTGIESRVTILGYIQRGGNPSAYDRIIASKMGSRAVELLIEGKSGRAIGIRGSQIIDLSIEDALNTEKSFHNRDHEIANELSI
ncbi:MAG: 6-phosphofructokinase [Andreesenia angusta]|nr:6-phosphofructokinase [Andreesenia angusta]